MLQNWAWLKGLIAAGLGGALTGAASAAIDGEINPSKMKGAAFAGALVTAAAYFKQSPVKPKDKPE